MHPLLALPPSSVVMRPRIVVVPLAEPSAVTVTARCLSSIFSMRSEVESTWAAATVTALDPALKRQAISTDAATTKIKFTVDTRE